MLFKTLFGEFELDIQLFPYDFTVCLQDYEYQKEISIKKSLSRYFVVLGYEKIALNRIKLFEKKENEKYDYFVMINDEIPFEDAIVAGFNSTSNHYTFGKGSIEMISEFLCYVLKTVVQNTPPTIYASYSSCQMKDIIHTVQTIFGKDAVGLPLNVRFRHSDKKYTTRYAQQYYTEAFGPRAKISNIPYLAGLLGAIIRYFFCEYTSNCYNPHVELIEIHRIILCDEGKDRINKGKIKKMVDHLHHFYIKKENERMQIMQIERMERMTEEIEAEMLIL